MVDLNRILDARDVAELKIAVADAFKELSVEFTNAEKIADIDGRLKKVEAKP